MKPSALPYASDRGWSWPGAVTGPEVLFEGDPKPRSSGTLSCLHPPRTNFSAIPSELSPAATLEGTSACVGGGWYVGPRPLAPLKGPPGPRMLLVALP